MNILFDGFNALHRYWAVASTMEGSNIVFDVGGSTFSRYVKLMRMFPDAHPVLVLDDVEKEREDKQLDENFIRSVGTLRRLFTLLGFSVVAQKGVSGDVLIAQCIGHCGEKLDYIIDSGDKDFAQLLSRSNIKLARYSDAGYAIWGYREVVNKWGVSPSQFVDYLTLVGDPSDGIRGVEGVGPKTAETLLREHGSIADFMIYVERNPNIRQPKKLANVIKEWDSGGISRRQDLLRLSTESVEGFTMERQEANLEGAISLLGKLKLPDIAYGLLENGSIY